MAASTGGGATTTQGETEGETIACGEVICAAGQVCFSYVDLGDLEPCPTDAGCHEKPGHDESCGFHNDNGCEMEEVACAEGLTCVEDQGQPRFGRFASHCLFPGEELSCNEALLSTDCPDGLECVLVPVRGYRCRVVGGAGTHCTEPGLDPAIDGCVDGLTCQRNVVCG